MRHYSSLMLLRQFLMTCLLEAQKNNLCSYARIISIYEFIKPSLINFNYSEPKSYFPKTSNHYFTLDAFNALINEKCSFIFTEIDSFSNVDENSEFIQERSKGIEVNDKGRAFWLKNEMLLDEVDLDFSGKVKEISPSIFFVNSEILSSIPGHLIDMFIEIIGDICFINNSMAGVDERSAYAALGHDSLSYHLKLKIQNFSKLYVDYHFEDEYFSANKLWTIFYNFYGIWKKYLDMVLIKCSDKTIKNQKSEAYLIFNNLVPYYLKEFRYSMLWFIYQRTLRGCFVYDPSIKSLSGFSTVLIFLKNLKVNVERHPEFKKLFSLTSPEQPYLLFKEAEDFNYLLNTETMLSRSIPESYKKILSNPANLSKEIVLAKLESIAIDLREIYPLIFEQCKPKDTFVSLECFNQPTNAIWHWEPAGDSLGYICLASKNIDYFLEQLSFPSRRYASYDLRLRINYAGQVCINDLQALNTELLFSLGLTSAYFINLYLMEKFHHLFLEKFFDIVDKISINQIVSSDLSDEALLVAKNQIYLNKLEIEEKIDLDQQVLEHKRPFRNIGHMKSKNLFKILAENFDCKIYPGKGSEVNISRVAHGGKIFRLGHHGKEVEISSLKISHILSRLNIGKEEWYQALEG